MRPGLVSMNVRDREGEEGVGVGVVERGWSGQERERDRETLRMTAIRLLQHEKGNTDLPSD